jgi:phage tail sheath protein FI
MPEYLAPGVYVEEVDTGSKPIEGVSTSTAGFVGMTRRGVREGLPELVTSFAEFERKFGGYFDLGSAFSGHNYLPYAVDGFFSNGGKRLYIMRVHKADATAAQVTTEGGIVTRLRENTVIEPASARDKLKLVNMRGIQAGTKFILHMDKLGIVKDSAVLEVKEINPTTGEITTTAAISGTDVFEAAYTTVSTGIIGLDAAGLPDAPAAPPINRPDSFIIKAKDAGSWGKTIKIQSSHESAARAEFDNSAPVTGVAGQNTFGLKSTAGFYKGAWVEIDTGTKKRYRQVVGISGNNITVDGPVLDLAALTPAAPATKTYVSTTEFRLSVSFEGVTEHFSGLTLANVPGRYYVDRINNGSSLISITGAAPASTHPFLFPSGANGQNLVLDPATGTDGTAPPDAQDYKGQDGGPNKRTGIKALEDIDQISIIAAPGVTNQVVQNALIEQCERLKDRFAILDPQPKNNNQPPGLSDIQSQRNLYDTKYAAIYYPRVMVYDPLTNLNIPVPPSGHLAGVYARTDIERGVHKAPANEVLRSITGLEQKINKEEQDILNPSPVNINVLRDFRDAGRGYRVWGARVITSDPDWKYINVRRLFIYIEESIDQGTQWVVFEPNDEPLWQRVRRTVTAFLTNVWRDGALQGRKPEEAFFVRCDRTTMTQDDIDNGRLIILVGIAPVKPAEFVIFRIGQWTGGSSIEEG